MKPHSISKLAVLAQAQGLDVLGHLTADQAELPDRSTALILLGPGPDFWDHLQGSTEMNDQQPDPMDRWSLRVVTDLANAIGGTAHFPFGGPPYKPFYTWALKSGRVWSSPVKLAVHDRYGLFVSFRGAIAVNADLDAHPEQSAPCDTCAQPCTSACPVAALTPDGYDVDRCHAYLDSPEGQDCMTQGCRVRRVCPVGQSLRTPAQSAYHMAQFHKT